MQWLSLNNYQRSRLELHECALPRRYVRSRLELHELENHKDQRGCVECNSGSVCPLGEHWRVGELQTHEKMLMLEEAACEAPCCVSSFCVFFSSTSLPANIFKDYCNLV